MNWIKWLKWTLLHHHISVCHQQKVRGQRSEAASFKLLYQTPPPPWTGGVFYPCCLCPFTVNQKTVKYHCLRADFGPKQDLRRFNCLNLHSWCKTLLLSFFVTWNRRVFSVYIFRVLYSELIKSDFKVFFFFWRACISSRDRWKQLHTGCNMSCRQESNQQPCGFSCRCDESSWRSCCL